MFVWIVSFNIIINIIYAHHIILYPNFFEIKSTINMKKIYYGKAIYDSKEINAVIKVLKNEGLSLVDGKNVKKLEKIVSRIFGKKFGLMVNSGSSANLLGLSSFNFKKGSVGLARAQRFNTEDSQFFIILRDEPLYETEYTPIGKVIYGLKALGKIKYSDRSQYVLRPDFINTFYMLEK